jgi:hypothetical protein
MQRFATTLAATLIIAVCAGCASAPSTPAPNASSSYKRIGIVSIMAQTYTRLYVGLTVFNNELEKVDISSWDLDTEYERQGVAALSALGGFEAVQGAYSRKEFAGLGEGGSAPKWEAVVGPAKEYCAKNQVDAIVIAFPGATSDFIGRSNQSWQGTGSYLRFAGQSYFHVVARVALLDCRTTQPAEVRDFGTLRGSAFIPGSTASDGPIKSASPELTRPPFKQLTEAQVAAIKSTLVDLPKSTWTPALRALLGK